MREIGRQRFTRPFMTLTTIVGFALCVMAAANLSVSQLDMRFVILMLLTLGIGSRLCVRIPGLVGTNGGVTVSDSLIFLTLLLFDGEAALLLAAAEALLSSTRISKKIHIILFNVSAMSCSIYLTTQLLRLSFGSITQLSHGGFSNAFFLALCLMAFTHYAVNSGLVAVGLAFKSNQPVWQIWKHNYLWTSISYFAGASTAGIIATLINVVGFYAILVVVPIIAIVYFTYWTYLKKVEVSAAQVEQAKLHLAAMQESEARFRCAFDYAAIGMALVSSKGSWLQVNRSLCGILGYSEGELLATNYQALTHTDDLPATLRQAEQLRKGEIQTFQLEKRYLHKLGHPVWALATASLVRDAQNHSARFIFQIQDITDRKRAEERLLHDAFHDALTGLPNRALFLDHLKLAVERAKRRRDYKFAVLFLDLDRFKVINDSLGHMVGDQLLVGIAQRLRSALRPSDTVARLGGDEFTVLLEDINKAEETLDVAERLQRELSQPFNIDGHEVFTTVSIGIAPSTPDSDRPETLLRDADTAMYRAKSLGKARHEMFDITMHDSAMNLLQMETDLRHAVEREEFRLHYQPIVSLVDGKLLGFEALIRWQHPERGFISPLDFIPVAEETGLIAPIGQWVLGEACRQMREWHLKFPAALPLSINVNLSGKQFTQPDMIGQIKRTLQQTGLDAANLKLEITESVMMESIETAAEMLCDLRALGIKLSIDDFGTGYSSLSYLHRFPIDTLKIDRSFVAQVDLNTENAEIVRTIMLLASNLGMDVIAEGIETTGQLAQLRAMNCESGQGYLFSKPLDASKAEDFIACSLSPATLKPQAIEAKAGRHTLAA